MGRLTHKTGSGWTYFVTTQAWNSTFIFQVVETAEIIVAKMLEYRDKRNYFLHDFVLMPNHLHVILAPCSASLEKCVQLIKGGSSFEIHKLRGSKSEIWQSGFHESRVTGPSDYEKKKDYVWFNPVAAKLVERPELWPYGSASGKYKLDPVPQGLKPIPSHGENVGAEAPTPGALPKTAAARAKIPEVGGRPQGLKPLPPKELEKIAEVPSLAKQAQNVGPKDPTPGAVRLSADGRQSDDVGPKGPTPVALTEAPVAARLNTPSSKPQRIRLAEERKK